MKQIMLSIIAVVGLVGFSSLSYAEEMRQQGNDMKGEMKGQKDNMKVMPDDMNTKGELKGQKDDMRTKPDDMNTKGELKGSEDQMKLKPGDTNSGMKGKTGEMGK